MKKVLVIGINGSPHKNGDTVKVLKEVLGGVTKNGGITKLLHLADFKMKPYHGFYKRKPDKETLRILKILETADGIVFATPTHWFSPSSLMKLLVDNLTYWEEVEKFKMENKVVGVVAHSWEDGAFTAARDLIGVLNTMGAVVPPYAINMRNKYLKKNQETEWMWNDMELLGKNMVIACEMVQKLKPNWDYKGKKFLEAAK